MAIRRSLFFARVSYVKWWKWGRGVGWRTEKEARLKWAGKEWRKKKCERDRGLFFL